MDEFMYLSTSDECIVGSCSNKKTIFLGVR